jgi:peptide deformylase
MSETPSWPNPLRLVQYPDPVLRQPCTEVTTFDQELQAFVERMWLAMDEWKGVGLAAPQVGVSKRIFVTNHRAIEDAGPDRRVWINPALELAGPRNDYEEGCLSIPGVYGKVERPSQVRIRWQDLEGTEHSTILDNDFLAVVVQHEFDHIQGILFLDHLPPTHLAMVRRRLKELEKAYKKETGKAGAVLRR